MKRIVSGVVVAAIVLGALTIVGCKEDQSSASQGECVVSGICLDASTSAYLADVAVQAQSVAAGVKTATTDASGAFRITFSTDSSGTATFTLKKTSYRDTTFVVTLHTGTVIALTLPMSPKSVVNPGASSSGLAQTITFLGSSTQEVSVYGVGGKETAILGYEVRDSLGLPIDATHAVNLLFTSANGPNGGEYISPTTVMTNAVGQAYTTFNAGTKSGVVQVTATASVGTGASARTIASSPVRLVINGGFPVQSHFSIAAARHNFPALGWVGKTNTVTVLVGDMYSNPVAPATAVYFRSSAGVIQPSIFTSKDGFGTVILYSGNPEPLNAFAAPVYGNGYHYVVARTLGQGAVVVEDSTLILWSGPGQISNVAPTSFTISNGGSQNFTFRVSDALGHPLSAGTYIAVTATIPPPPTAGQQQNQVIVVFGVNGTIELPDVILSGAGSTDFSFALKDGTWSITDATPVNITINVLGPNVPNSLSYTVGGLVY
jgi:hypothetical protein